MNFKNLTGTKIRLEDHDPFIDVPAGGEADLLEHWNATDIQNSPQLANLLSQGSDKYQLEEYTASQALTHVSSGIWNPGPVGANGAPLVQTEQAEGSEKLFVSHNFCDKCTWFMNSQRITGEILSDSGDGLTFNSANPFWIDLNHGRYYNEDQIKASYLPNIYINGVKTTEKMPFSDPGSDDNDFTINYRAGTVTFFSNQSGKIITADYSKATDSMFIIAPDSGKTWRYEEGVIDFTSDIVFKDSVIYQPYAYNPSGPPIPKVPAGSKEVFKTILNFWAEARNAPPQLPAVGGLMRGTQNNTIELPFKRQKSKLLPDAYGAEIRICLENDIEFEGEYAAITLYGSNI
jgi:hypothetical protein